MFRDAKKTLFAGGGLQPSDLANFVYGLNRNDTTTDPAAKTPPVVLVKGPPGPQAKKKKKKNPERGLRFSFV